MRAPYAQDEEEEEEEEERSQQSSRGDYSSRDSRGGGGPNRFTSTAQESYAKPDTSFIAPKLPLPPSKQTYQQQQQPASRAAGTVAKQSGTPRTPGDTPWASHDEADTRRSNRPPSASSNAAPAVPTLALNKVTQVAYEPYASVAAPASANQRAQPAARSRIERDEDDEENARRERERHREGQQQDEDVDEEEQQYRWREAERRRRVAEYEEEERRADAHRGGQQQQQQHPRRDDSRGGGGGGDEEDEYARYDAPRGGRGGAPRSPPDFGRRQDLDGHEHSNQRGAAGRGAHRYDDRDRDHHDEEDQVSRPVQHMRVSSGQSQQYGYDNDDRGRRADSRDRSPPRHGGDRNGDRNRRQYQDPDDYDSPRDNCNGYRSGSQQQQQNQQQQPSQSQSQAQSRQPTSSYASANAPYGTSFSSSPSSSSSAAADASSLSVRERAVAASRSHALSLYGEVAAGRSSGLEPHAQSRRAHAPIFGAADPEPSKPAKKSNRQDYEAYVERSNREPKRHMGPSAYDPTAAGARTLKSIDRYAHLDSGFSIGHGHGGGGGAGSSERAQTYSGIQEGREEVLRRGVASTRNSNSNSESRGLDPNRHGHGQRNPILQDSPRYDPRPGSFSQDLAAESRGGPSSLSAQSSDDHQHQRWTREVSHRRAAGMHPSIESAQLESSRVGAKDIQPACGNYRRDASSVGGITPDRGVRIVGDRSYRSSNIFGPPAASSQEQPQSVTGAGAGGGVMRLVPDRNASHDSLVSHNALYETRPQTGYFDSADDRDAHSRSGSGSGSGHTNASGAPYSNAESSVSYEATRVHRSAEHQAERDAYEQQLRRLHEERLDTERRGGNNKTKGHQSSRLW